MQCVFQVRRYLFRVCISRVWKQRERTNKEKREEKKKNKTRQGEKIGYRNHIRARGAFTTFRFSAFTMRESPQFHLSIYVSLEYLEE